MSIPKKVESVAIRKLIFEDETGARVVVVLPRPVSLQEGGVLSSLSLGAISTTVVINDFKKARLKAQDIRTRMEAGELLQEQVVEIVHGSTQEKFTAFDPEAQAATMSAAGDQPPVFVPTGDEKRSCSCDEPKGTRRCLNCGLLIA